VLFLSVLFFELSDRSNLEQFSLRPNKIRKNGSGPMKWVSDPRLASVNLYLVVSLFRLSRHSINVPVGLDR
jgi:hypothetical protein